MSKLSNLPSIRHEHIRRHRHRRRPRRLYAAIRAAQLGLKTACVDAWIGKDGKPALGGTCLNVGCIPSKALLDSSKQFYNLTHISTSTASRPRTQRSTSTTMIGRKDKIVKQFTGGVGLLFKATRSRRSSARQTAQGHRKVEVTATATNVQTIAPPTSSSPTGSVPIELPFAKFDSKLIIDNAGALDFTDVPKRLGVVGAGVIGLELGSVWKRLGADVTVLEALPDFLAVADRDIAKAPRASSPSKASTSSSARRSAKAEIKNDEVHSHLRRARAQSARRRQAARRVGRCRNRGPARRRHRREARRTRPHRRRRAFPHRRRWRLGLGDCVRGPMLAHKG